MTMPRSDRSPKTFGERLKHFARALDYVDEDTLSSVQQMCHEFITGPLGMGYYEVLVDRGTPRDITRAQLLETAETRLRCWSTSPERRPPYEISTASGTPKHQITLPYITGRAFWLHGSKSECLAEAETYLDALKNIERIADVPRYTDEGRDGDGARGMKTSILMPLTYGRRVFGVINMESKLVLNHTERGFQELKNVVDAIGTLFWLSEAGINQRRLTGEAIRELQAIYDARHDVSLLVDPKVFIGTSNRADPAVVGTLRTVVSGFAVKECYWKDFSKTGDINANLLKVISECAVGIFYLSEPADPANRHRFIDNANVLFEAGMLHALVSPVAGGPSAMIPVRESDSPRGPFDIAAIRSIMIERNDKGPNDELLIASLESMLASTGITRKPMLQNADSGT